MKLLEKIKCIIHKQKETSEQPKEIQEIKVLTKEDIANNFKKNGGNLDDPSILERFNKMIAIAENFLEINDCFAEYSRTMDCLRFLLINRKKDLCMDYILYPEPDELGCDIYFSVYHWKKYELLVLDRDKYESFLEHVKKAFHSGTDIVEEEINKKIN